MTNYRCRLGSLGNSFTASGCNDQAPVGPSGHLFFCVRCTFHIRLSSYLLPLFLCLISFLLFPCAGVWKTLVHEFHISYGHTEWYLHFSRVEIVFTSAEASPIKNVTLMY